MRGRLCGAPAIQRWHTCSRSWVPVSAPTATMAGSMATSISTPRHPSPRSCRTGSRCDPLRLMANCRSADARNWVPQSRCRRAWSARLPARGYAGVRGGPSPCATACRGCTTDLSEVATGMSGARRPVASCTTMGAGLRASRYRIPTVIQTARHPSRLTLWWPPGANCGWPPIVVFFASMASRSQPSRPSRGSWPDPSPT